MELSINISNLLGRYPLAKAAELYHSAGFTACDYSLGEMVSDDSVFNTDRWREAAEEVRRVAEQAGLRINQTHAPFTFRHWEDEAVYREVIYPRLCRSVEISAILGAGVVVMHPLHHFVYHGHEREIFEANMAFYRSLLPLCRNCHIKVGVENMYQVDPRRKHIVFDTCATKEEFVRYIDTLDSEYMVACLDLGHVGLPLQDDEAQDVVRALGHDRLQALHVHDNDYRGDNHNPFNINMGQIHGGTIATSVPDEVVIEGRIAFSPDEDVVDAKKIVEDAVMKAAEQDSWLREHLPEVEWHSFCLNSGQIPVDHPLTTAICQAYEEVAGEPPVISGTPWGTDAGAMIRVGGIPTVVFGPGPNAKAHQANEYVEEKKLLQVAKVIASTILDWCEVQ